ncbi:hypothetical protein GCM10010216_52700 [Streptomyces flaveolus]|nr:hypothetical protein GCM10010216_52700 [Streptomyces flaveolus]
MRVPTAGAVVMPFFATVNPKLVDAPAAREPFRSPSPTATGSACGSSCPTRTYGVLTALRPQFPFRGLLLHPAPVPATGRGCAARGRHPPPIVRHPDGRTRVPDLSGRVVLGGAPQALHPLTDFRLGPGAVLALRTHGRVERPGGRALASRADRLTAAARHVTDRPDDSAPLLATRRPGPGAPGEAGPGSGTPPSLWVPLASGGPAV